MIYVKEFLSDLIGGSTGVVVTDDIQVPDEVLIAWALKLPVEVVGEDKLELSSLEKHTGIKLFGENIDLNLPYDYLWESRSPKVIKEAWEEWIREIEVEWWV